MKFLIDISKMIWRDIPVVRNTIKYLFVALPICIALGAFAGYSFSLGI